jgi:hypothetical protein
MSSKHLIDIREYRIRLPSKLYPYKGKQGIQVRHAGLAHAGDPGWIPITSLSDDFFHPAFDKRNAFNIPGPFYGAETDTCETGPAEAPGNVLMDRVGQEFVFKQPSNEEELRNVFSAALCECFCGYGADGDDHWTLSLIREWWRSRHKLLSDSASLKGLPASILAWQRLLAGEGEQYLRAYAFFVEERRIPTDTDVLPEVS